MKKLLLATLLASIFATSAQAADDTINIGIEFGFTGPIESLAPMMAASAELALKEVSDSKALLGGKTLKGIRADDTCVDAANATTAAERLVTSDKIVALIGASCSGAATAVANNVLIPKGIPMISSSATAPALTTLDDKGFVFRTAPSDARQGELLAEIVKNRGVDEVVITYTNNDYGKGLNESFGAAFKKLGGKIVASTAHTDGQPDYSADVAALKASGAKTLVVFGYADQGGKGIVQASLDSGAFDKFIFADGMIGEGLTKNFGDKINGAFGTMPGGETEGSKKWEAIAKENKIDPTGGPYRGESYDAAAVLAFAIQAAGKADPAAIQAKIKEVANAPGEKIYAGELAKGLKLLSEGKDIDYVGATGIEFDDAGDVKGAYREVEVKAGKFETIKAY